MYPENLSRGVRACKRCRSLRKRCERDDAHSKCKRCEDDGVACIRQSSRRNRRRIRAGASKQTPSSPASALALAAAHTETEDGHRRISPASSIRIPSTDAPNIREEQSHEFIGTLTLTHALPPPYLSRFISRCNLGDYSLNSRTSKEQQSFHHTIQLLTL